MNKAEFFAFNFKKSTKSYRNIQARIQRLYDKYGSNVDYETLYRKFQKIDEKIRTDIVSHYPELSKKLDRHKRVWYSMDDKWIYVNQSPLTSMDIIKVYATPVDPTHVLDIYNGALALLLKSKNGFGSKVSRIKRSDPLCFWVERKDFFKLEKYLKQFELTHAVPFIPYRGNIGISRETIESYNCSFSQLLALYFATKPAKIHLVDMYHFLVDLLDMEETDINYDSLYRPHTTIVLLKSMELIVNEEEIPDDHPLLWDSWVLRDAVREFDRW